jgi:hypothetical protein
MIFKQASSENELFEGMQQAEEEASIQEEGHTDSLIYEALQNLDLAAKAFEEIGMAKEAQSTTRLMVKIASGKRDSNQSIEEAKQVFSFFGFNQSDLPDHLL